MMTVDERERHELHTRLAEILGEPAATTLMSHLPPTGWGDVATKHDLAALSRELRAEIAGLRGETEAGFAQLRGEMETELSQLRGEMGTGFAQLRGEMETGLSQLRGEMGTGFAQLRGEVETGIEGLRGEMYEQIARQTRLYIYSTLTAVVATGGLAFGAAGLAG